MKQILTVAFLLTLAAGSAASAGPDHHHRVCMMRHHHRVCSMR